MIKLQPVLKDYLWGGEKLKTLFGREKQIIGRVRQVGGTETKGQK